jgi:predicted phage-related endonuclease
MMSEQQKIANKRINEALENLHAAKALLKMQQDVVEQYEDVIKKYLGDNDTLLGKNNKVLATWKESKGAEGFDKKRFADEHPIIYKKYITIGKPIRKFLLKPLV